ncbi:uncharacterized protein LOC143577820 [Bidens hawaiensis]|uniref:uncharacterized protein LOC143577820 n=1 Tax=Bidens hawaiensis TaxID=980011 RepID=UPI00404A779A
MFQMYPRFLQMIFDSHYPELNRYVETLDLKAVGLNTFGLMKKSRKGAKVIYQGLHPLVIFGKFAETEAVDAAVVAEEHVVPVQRHSTAFETISVDESDSSPSQPLEIENQVQQFVPTIEQLEAFVTFKGKLQSTALKPPQQVVVTNDDDDVEIEPATYLIPRKRRKKDPRPGVLESDLVQTVQPTHTEPIIETQSEQGLSIEAQHARDQDDNDILQEFNFEAYIQSTTEPSGSSNPIGQESSSASEKIAHILSMQDKFLQAKGKGIALEPEPVDIHALLRRVFELEQDSVIKDACIQELEASNTDKDSKIQKLQASMGGLTA